MERKPSIERGWRENHQWNEDGEKIISGKRMKRKASIERGWREKHE